MTRKGGAKPEIEPATGGAANVFPGQRLDKWLWCARVVKSRSLAAGLIEAGRVRVNRVKVDKPKQIVRPGDVVTATVHRKVRVLKVVLPGTRRGPAPEAQTLFEDLTPPEVPAVASVGTDGQGAVPRVLPVAQREPGSSRPTKRERRQIDKFRQRDDG